MTLLLSYNTLVATVIGRLVDGLCRKISHDPHMKHQKTTYKTKTTQVLLLADSSLTIPTPVGLTQALYLRIGSLCHENDVHSLLVGVLKIQLLR